MSTWFCGLNNTKKDDIAIDERSSIYNSVFTYNTERNFQSENYYSYGNIFNRNRLLNFSFS